MKKHYFLKCFIALVFMIVGGKSWGQTTVFQFDFESGTTVSTDNAAGTPTFTQIGTVTVTSGACTGTAGRNASSWDANDAIRFTVNTTGYSNLSFSYQERTSNVNINNFLVRVSTNLTSWTTIRTSYIPPTACTSSGVLSLGSSFDNQSTVYIEIIKANAPGAATTTFRIDNATLIGTPINQPPSITSNGGGSTASLNVAENSTLVTTVTATDDASTPTYSISGGVDAAKFSINSTSGVLTFTSAPDYETPTDVGADNTYEVIVRASDGSLTDDQTITVTVTEVPELSYYPRTDATDLSQPSNWTTDVNGVTVDPPSNFSNANQIFNINRNAPITGTWTLAGSDALMSGTAILTVQSSSRIESSAAGSDFDLNGNSVILKSDASNTATIGTITGTLTDATNVTVERYISSLNNRAYRLLAPSVYSQGTIKANWQEDVNNPDVSTNLNPNPGYGTHITGSTTGANGFDATQTGAASLFSYNPATESYEPFGSTSSNVLAAQIGYLLFIRGDRTASHISASATSSNTTLRARGALLIGNADYSLQDIGKFTLVTNPYASSINWNTIYSDASTKGLENFYTYVDPNVGTRGGYVTVTNGGIRNNNAAGVNGTVNIQSGQAFFVKTSAADRALIIKETHKSTTNNIDVFRIGTPEQFNIGLYFTANSVRRSADGVTVVYNNNYSTDIDGNDAEEMGNFDENIAIKRNGKMLAIEGRPLIDVNDTISLSMARMKIQDYEFEFTPVSFNAPGLQAFLQDKFLNTETAVSLTAKTVISFSVTSNTASSVTDRFQVVFRQSVTLPVNMSNVKAYEKAKGIQVEWTTLSESNIERYEVEKSTNGVNFSIAGKVSATGNSSIQNYSMFDPTPATGLNYYRIKTLEKNGSSQLSKVVKVNIAKGKGGIAIYPNPVSGNVLSLKFTDLLKDRYRLAIINDLGQQVYITTIIHNGGSATQTLSLPVNLLKGVYQLQLSGSDNTMNLKLIKN